MTPAPASLTSYPPRLQYPEQMRPHLCPACAPNTAPVAALVHSVGHRSASLGTACGCNQR